MKKIICFAGFAESELPDLKAATATSKSLWECYFVPNAPTAMALLAKHPFDALVANMAMTGRNGAELLHDVREDCPHTMGFIVGEVTDQSLIINSIGGPHQFIRRPIQPARLVTILKRGLSLDNWLATDDLRKLVPKLRRLPSLPSTYFNLLKEIESEKTSIQNIGAVIARDPVVTARLLRMVNSAAFSLVEKVSDPIDAVTLLGIDTVRSLVMGLQVFTQSDVARKAGISLEILWEHSLLVAKFARQITLKQTGDARLAGDAFTAGLLHDVGRIVLASNLPEEYATIIAKAREHSLPLHEEETAVLRVNHAEVGAYLLGLWGLPVEIVEATAGHHTPGETVFAQEFSLLGAVHAANVFAHEGGGQTDGLVLPQIDHEYFKTIKLDDQLDAWREVCTGENLEKEEDEFDTTQTPAVEKVKITAPPPTLKLAGAPSGPAIPVQPLPPIVEPVTHIAYSLLAVIALFLIIGGIVVWYLHSSSTSSSSPDMVAASAPTNDAEAQPPVTAANVQPLPPPPAPVAPATSTAATVKATNVKTAVVKPAPPAGHFANVKVQGIFYRTDNPLAIINGKTVGVGDQINGFQVAGIDAHSVTLSLNGEQKIFNFH